MTLFALNLIKSSVLLASESLLFALSGAKSDSEYRVSRWCRLALSNSVKARNAAEGGACPEHGGGWGASARSARDGGNGLYGMPGLRPGNLVRSRLRCVADRTLHYAKSILILPLSVGTDTQTEPFICPLLGVYRDE